MEIWNAWLSVVSFLRPACGRGRTFLWFASVLAGFSIRADTLGVTSIMRALGFLECCYDRIMDFFNSRALDVSKLTLLWTTAVMRIFNPVKINGRLLIPADGIKVPKTGRKMPGVKRLHQESNNNNKPEYIFGHSIQAAGILAGAFNSVFCVPLVARIHEGLIFSRNDKATTMDKLIGMLNNLTVLPAYYLIADAYYSCAPVIRGLLDKGNHLISRVRMNAVAYRAAPKVQDKHKRGRKKKFGRKIKLTSLFSRGYLFKRTKCVFYGKKDVTVLVACLDLVMRRTGIMTRYVLVRHPQRGDIILMTTDLTLEPEKVIAAYMLRFKIEVSFKQAIHTVGTYLYHFWSKCMKAFTRKSGNQVISGETEKYKGKIMSKVDTYHRHIQMGIIAQGLLQYLSSIFSEKIRSDMTTYIRTKKKGNAASEAVVRDYMREVFPEFLVTSGKYGKLTEFIRRRLQPKRWRFMRLAS